MYKYIKII